MWDVCIPSTRTGDAGMSYLLSRPALNDRQLARMSFRLALFTRRGLDDRAADALADKLAQRDYERDDRTVCLECQHLQKSGGCFAAQQGWMAGVDRRMQPIRDLLQRCEFFAFVTP